MSIAPAAQAVAPKRQRGRDRVEAILEAATALFDEKPYEAVTMTEVAARSATAIGSLYRFFPTKQALAVALLGRYGEKLHGALDALVENPRELSSAQVGQELVAIVQDLRRDRSVALALLDAEVGRPLERKSMRAETLSRFERLLARLGASSGRLGERAAMLLSLFKSTFVLPQDDPELGAALDAEAAATLAMYLERARR